VDEDECLFDEKAEMHALRELGAGCGGVWSLHAWRIIASPHGGRSAPDWAGRSAPDSLRRRST
jgi:hypothetical protein